MIITTENGTKFSIDLVNKTWARIDKTGDSGNLRTESGTYNEIQGPVIGEPCRVWCNNIYEWAGARLIMTTNIIKIEE